MDDQKTPTAANFAGVPGQKPLPNGELDGATAAGTAAVPSRNDSKRSATSADSRDVEMGEDGDGDNAAGSDDESIAGGSKSKKKKGQRFYCTDYPPCNLSFTRSEHLARHIRKHTGERPFQCHCLRRFSRLDNLRQHAQTVHVNEDIPPESLAATGTRFQRQIRTDRVRPSGRSRPSTSGTSAANSAAAMHSRGHSRNVSNSSIGSISDLGSPDDARRRPAPPPSIAMAQGTSPQSNLSIDTYSASPYGQSDVSPYYGVNSASPGGYNNNNTQNTFASGAGLNQRYHQSGLGSPISMMPPGHGHHHSHSGSGQSHARRLSQPSAFNPYQQDPYYSPPPQNGPYFIAPSSASTYSNSGSMFASPTSTAFLPDGRHESSAEAEWRRRTWHPGTYSNVAPRPATSGLSYYQTPENPQPVSSEQPAAAQQGSVRLPGIDSFDRGNPAPPRRPLSTMEVDESTRQAHDATTRQLEGETPSKRDSWSSMNQHFSHLDVQSTPTKTEAPAASWRHSAPSGPVKPSYHATPSFTFPPQSNAQQSLSTLPEQQQTSPPNRRKRREAWYNGPMRTGDDSISTVRTSPEGSLSSDGLPTPSNQTNVEYNPAIVHSNGYVENPHHGGSIVDDSPKVTRKPRSELASYAFDSFPSSLDASRPPARHLHAGAQQNTSRLDALVAVATNEERALKGH